MKDFTDMKEEALKNDRANSNLVTCFMCGREIDAHWDYCYYCGQHKKEDKKGE